MSQEPGLISIARKEFHAALLQRVLFSSSDGIPSNADSKQKTSVRIANRIAEQLKVETGKRLVAQKSGAEFEEIVAAFLVSTFGNLKTVRPGNWDVRRLTQSRRGKKGKPPVIEIANFQQFAHLGELALVAYGLKSAQLKAAIGESYLIVPDILIARLPESDARINELGPIVDDESALRTGLRASNTEMPILHASISCKWTMRSDRAQNSRAEALNLLRNRKGSMPHAVCVVGEPTPARLSSLALGTGDLDCVYHFALPELIAACEEEEESTQELLAIMVEGKRLRDISDLPLDLAV